MSWIEEIGPADAEGYLKEIYEEIESKRGKVSNVMKAQSLNPEAMKNHLDLYTTLLFDKSKLTRKERELIAVVVSS